MNAAANRQLFARIAADLGAAAPCAGAETAVRGGATSAGYRLRLAGGAGAGGELFVKQYTPAESDSRQPENDYATARWLATELGAGAEPRVVAPLLLLPETRAIVMPFVAGENLGRYFHRRLRWGYVTPATADHLLGLAARLGAALARLQRIPAERVRHFFGCAGPAAALAGLRRELADHVGFLRGAGCNAALLEAAAAAIENCVADDLARHPSGCFQHNDYTLQNFILGADGGLYLFDFANATCGSRCFDMAHMLNAFEDLAYLRTVSWRLVERLQRAFLRPLEEQGGFQPRQLAALRAYIQLYSSRILLGAGKRRRTALRGLAMASPRRRLETMLRARLAEIGR